MLRWVSSGWAARWARIRDRFTGHNLVVWLMLIGGLCLWTQKKRLIADDYICEESIESEWADILRPFKGDSLYSQAFIGDVVVWLKRDSQAVGDGEIESGRSYVLARLKNTLSSRQLVYSLAHETRDHEDEYCVVDGVMVRVVHDDHQSYLGLSDMDDLDHFRLSHQVYLVSSHQVQDYDLCQSRRIRYAH